MKKIYKKINVLMMQVIIIIFSLCMLGCNNSPNENGNESEVINVEYDNLLYYGQTGKICVTPKYDDDEIVVESLNEKIIKVESVDSNNYRTTAVTVGVAQIAIFSSYLEEEMIIEITVESVVGHESPIENIELSMVEEGPYYTNMTYHLKIDIFPSVFKDTYRFLDSEDYELNEEEMTIVFKRAGKMNIGAFSEIRSKRFSIFVDVKANPDSNVYDILFIGNSLTFVNDIPKIIQNMITADGECMIYSEDTPGDTTLKDHEIMFNMYVEKYAFSHVILQGASFEVISDKGAFLENMEKFGKKAKATGAQVILYQTWAYNRESYKGLTKYEMLEQIKVAYEEAANKIGAKISRSGEAFKLFEETYGKTPSLYKDTNHQSLYGAYLSACVHYSTITGKKASDNTYLIDGLDIEIVKNIQKIADQISFGE